MGVFNFFGDNEHRVFNYKPIYYNPEEEERKRKEEEEKKKPLSDRELTEKLVAEGIQISRRTVAKYRESMGISGASGRKVF